MASWLALMSTINFQEDVKVFGKLVSYDDVLIVVEELKEVRQALEMSSEVVKLYGRVMGRGSKFFFILTHLH